MRKLSFTDSSNEVLPVETKISFPLILIIAFVAQILMAGGIVGYLSFKNGQQAIDDLDRS